MNYRGRYRIFETGSIRTYPVEGRSNKVGLAQVVRPEEAGGITVKLGQETAAAIETVAAAMAAARTAGRPVVVFTGAHLIKNGLGWLLRDLVEQGWVTLAAGNGATAIHDFELALIGATSEDVPAGLETGAFGMAYEFCYINAALAVGDEMALGFGESLGRMMVEAAFREEVLKRVGRDGAPRGFVYPEVSVLAGCYKKGTPFTVHAGVGTDVIDQHESFDGRAKGGCSGRDFLIFTEEVARMNEGGVVVNIGSAVTGPEVLLKAASMAANVGRGPRGIVTADFDLREGRGEQRRDDSKEGYYYRDQKSVVGRIPEAFGGKGIYVQGNQKETFVFLYQRLLARGGAVGRGDLEE